MNPADYKHIAPGQDRRLLPLSIGFEVAGIVTAIGPDTQLASGGGAIGNEVLASVISGGYASAVTVPASDVFAKPGSQPRAGSLCRSPAGIRSARPRKRSPLCTARIRRGSWRLSPTDDRSSPRPAWWYRLIAWRCGPPARCCGGYARWLSPERRIARCSVQLAVQRSMAWQYQRMSGHPEPPSATMSDVGRRVPHSPHHALPRAASRGCCSGPLDVPSSVSLIAVIAAVCS